MNEELSRKAATGRQADLVASLRRLSKGPASQRPSNGGAARPGEESCDLCGNPIGADHRHLLEIEERHILCVCESCLALRGGDREFRPTGTRVVWLEGLELPDELWASFSIPIGLAFFLHSSATGGIVSLYPSPAGATESELDVDAWGELVRANPILASLEPDAEALIVNRTAEPHQHAIAPIDECYRLVGMVRASWEGISGGTGPERAIATFFAELEEKGAQPR
jgi:Family of unknown function (DUF5947)